MKALPSKCIIKADKDRNVEINLKGGLQLVLPPAVKKFQEYHSHIVTQDGIVVAPPEWLKNGQPVEVEEGDHIYGHHFLCYPDKKLLIDDEDCYNNDYESIYCKVDEQGNITMVGEWNFVIPIYPSIDEISTDSGILLTYKHDEIPNIGKIIYPSSYLQSQGVKENDLVIFKDNCEYEILIEQKMFYRISDKNMLGTIKGLSYQEKKEIAAIDKWKFN